MEGSERQRAVERILEDEAITTGLVDSAARFLLEWTVKRIREIEQDWVGCPGEEVVRRLAELREATRRIARLAGQAPSEEQLQQVQALLWDEVEDKSDEALS